LVSIHQKYQQGGEEGYLEEDIEPSGGANEEEAHTDTEEGVSEG